MNYLCPICSAELTLLQGEKMHPNDPKFGITLTCMNAQCNAQEVMAHGDKAKDAWETIQHKFIDKKDREKD